MKLLAQIEPLRQGETYTNTQSQTVFIVPRQSLERILVKAQAFDSLAPLFPKLIADTALLKNENDGLRESVRAERREKYIAILIAIASIAFLIF